jgi:hypothetical protein
MDVWELNLEGMGLLWLKASVTLQGESFRLRDSMIEEVGHYPLSVTYTLAFGLQHRQGMEN